MENAELPTLDIPLSGLGRLKGRKRQKPQSIPDIDGSSIKKRMRVTHAIPPIMQPSMSMRFEEGTLRLRASSTIGLEVLFGSALLAVRVSSGRGVVTSTMPGPCLGGEAVGEIPVPTREGVNVSARSTEEAGDAECVVGIGAGVAMLGDGGGWSNIVCSTFSIGNSSPSVDCSSNSAGSMPMTRVALGEISGAAEGVDNDSGEADTRLVGIKGMISARHMGAVLKRVRTKYRQSLRTDKEDRGIV